MGKSEVLVFPNGDPHHSQNLMGSNLKVGRNPVNKQTNSHEHNTFLVKVIICLTYLLESVACICMWYLITQTW